MRAALTLSTVMLLLVASQTFAQEGKIVTSRTVLTSGETSNIGGGKQVQLGAFNVCRADKMSDGTVELATATALSKLGLSLDPPTTDFASTIKMGDEWKTSPATLQSQLIEEYNASTELKLGRGYRFYVIYYGRVMMKGSTFILQTMTALRTGNNSQETHPYRGDFDPDYFHKRLQAQILKDLQADGCS